MKDNNLNNKPTNPNTANDNTAENAKVENVKEDVNKNVKVVKKKKNSNKKSKNKKSIETSGKKLDAGNSKDESDKINVEQEGDTSNIKETAAKSAAGKPKASTTLPETAAKPAAEKPEASTTPLETVAKSAAEKPEASTTPLETVAKSVAEKPEALTTPLETVAKSAAEKPEASVTPPEASAVEKPEASTTPAAVIPSYNYSPDQWSPFNKSGKKCYDIGLLKQIKDDPLSKSKPNIPLLESCNVMRTEPMMEPLSFAIMSRPMNDSLFPTFAKSSSMGPRNNTPHDITKDGRSMPTGGRGSAKLPSTPSSGSHKPVVHVSLSLREEVKLNETKNPWKPLRFKKENISEEEYKTQEVYKKFIGILNKLTPQKFDALLDKVKTLEINTEKRLAGVIDLIFEKAIEEPNFSEAYAAMCNRLSMLKVPADNATSPDQYVNFRALIISKCQAQFITDKVDEQVQKLEKELHECTDPAKKKELKLMLEEENRRVRLRSVGNVRFIGELYKLKMLTSKIMVYCMNYLIDKLEEEKLECLCKLLTTIGQQVESEVKDQLDKVFKQMQEIIDKKSGKISSRVRFMIQDVIDLRRRRWVSKSVVDSQPKMMDQIQKEAEQQQRHIELMNATPTGYRRDDGGRGKRGGDGRRQGSNLFVDNTWKTPSRPNYTVDASKLKAVTQKNLTNIKLAPHMSAWNQGSGTKSNIQSNSGSLISLSKNMYSMLEINTQADPISLRGNKDMSLSYSKGASIERSTFNPRGDFNSGSGSKTGSVGLTQTNSSSQQAINAGATPTTNSQAIAPMPQERLPEDKRKIVKSMIELCLINPDDEEMVAEIKQRFPPQFHADVVTEILNVVLEKSAKDVAVTAKSMVHLISTNTIAAENFLAGLKEILEFAPDLHIDIPMLYEYLGQFIAPLIEKKHITFGQIFSHCENLISNDHGHLLLKAIIKIIDENMGPSFVKTKWQESGLNLSDWMKEDHVSKWIEDNKFQFLEGGAISTEDTKKLLSPSETQSKLLQLMNSDENCDCIKGWVQDNLGKSSNEDWFMRALIQAVCEHALFGPEGRRDLPHFDQERMNKYSRLINEFGESQQARESNCLFGIQQLIHRLEHPQGLSLEIFQYLHEQDIITTEGFIAWEESDLEKEGKGVMMKALTSFFTNIRETDNEDSCSED